MTKVEFDLTIIGAGPGGTACALRAVGLGLRVALIDKRDAGGGTCLHVGCIPSKALLTASEKLREALHGLSGFGITARNVSFDLNAMMSFKNKVIADTAKGLSGLYKSAGIAFIQGTARIEAPGRVRVGERELTTDRIVIATGSVPASIPGITPDGNHIVTSEEALSFAAVPKKLAVIGAGYIGLELGSVWARLGSSVTVIEIADRILPGLDADVAKALHRWLAADGLDFCLGRKVLSVEQVEDGVALHLDNGETHIANKVLVAVGRVPATEGFDVALDERGFIEVDDDYATSVAGIYAIGDAIAGPMLAHRADADGICLAERLAGQASAINSRVVPAVVFTAPEAASVGRTEEELTQAGIKYRVGKASFMANGRARAALATQGFVKILADAHTDHVLGVHILGAEAGVMIHEAALAMEFDASAEDIARTVHAHPTFSEVLREAALTLR